MAARCIFMTFSIWNFELELLHAIGFLLIRKCCVYMCTTLKNFSYLGNVQCAYHLAKMHTGEDRLEIPETAGRTSWLMTLPTCYTSEVKIWELYWLEWKYFTGLDLHWSVVTLDWIGPFSKGHDPFIPEVQWLYWLTATSASINFLFHLSISPSNDL